jgi:hypothetical protein
LAGLDRLWQFPSGRWLNAYRREAYSPIPQ